MSASPRTYAVGDKVPIWITGMVPRYEAEVLRLDENGYPDRLKVLNDPSWAQFTLKPGDFGIWDDSDGKGGGQ